MDSFELAHKVASKLITEPPHILRNDACDEKGSFTYLDSDILSPLGKSLRSLVREAAKPFRLSGRVCIMTYAEGDFMWPHYDGGGRTIHRFIGELYPYGGSDYGWSEQYAYQSKQWCVIPVGTVLHGCKPLPCGAYRVITCQWFNVPKGQDYHSAKDAANLQRISKTLTKLSNRIMHGIMR